MGISRWAFVLCVLTCACPTDDGEQGGVSPCAAYAAWEKRCNAEEPYWGDTECQETRWKYVQRPVTKAMIDCFEKLECDASDDRCEAEGLSAIGLNDEADVADDALFQTCRDRVEACDVLDDYCVAVLVSTTEGRAKLDACFKRECSEVEACLRDPE